MNHEYIVISQTVNIYVLIVKDQKGYKIRH